MPKMLPPTHSRFKPGESGNKSGRPKLPKELALIRSLTADEVKKIISKFAEMKKSEIEMTLDDPSTPILHLAIASIFNQCAKHGDYGRLSFLLDRAVGKAPMDESGEPSESGKIFVMKYQRNSKE